MTDPNEIFRTERAKEIVDEMPKPIPRMDPKKLDDFVRDCVEGRIFTSAQIEQPDMLNMVFMVIALGGMSQISNPEEIGIAWEYMDKASPRGVNGYPCFFSCYFMHIEDWKIAHPRILEWLKKLDGGSDG
jgi:hypothetical protein